MNHKNTILLNGNNLSISEVINVAKNHTRVDFTSEIKEKIHRARLRLEKQIVRHPEIKIYGTNVLHGNLKDKQVSIKLLEKYQIKYIKSHNCGTGKPLPIEVVRAIIVIRLNSFAKGLSGMQLETCQLMIDMLNNDLTPWVLEEGSVGASGDLVPLAMIASTLIGLPEAKAYYHGKLLKARHALKSAGLKPIKLGAKEAMGLTNGSNFICALAVFSYHDAKILLKTASISSALSLEAIRGEKNAFSSFINNNRPHPGQLAIAKQIRILIKNSKRMSEVSQKFQLPDQNTATAGPRVQDRYSFRAIPQVHGTTCEALEKLKNTLIIEINSATDNPLFDFKNSDKFLKAYSGANFHGQPLAAVIDYAKITLTSLGLITDKRTFSLLDNHLSYGLPEDLAYDTKKADGGLMIAQYAGAARAAESRVLATPSSITSISTAANQEDFVSMGSIGALHLTKVIYNTQILVAVELLCAVRALQLTEKKLPKNLRPLGIGTQKIYNYLNKILGPVGEDKFLRSDIEKIIDVVRSGKLVKIIF